MEDINRQDLIKLFQNYVGMYPKDVNCQNWNEMQQKLADEVITLSKSKEKDIPKDKDWEILTCKNKIGFLHPYHDGTKVWTECLISGCTIHSVKRLSDGEVFTVGDEIEAREGEYCSWENIYKIISMSIQTGLLAFEIMNVKETNPTGSIWREIENIRKPKVPLFTCETGQKIFDDYDGIIWRVFVRTNSFELWKPYDLGMPVHPNDDEKYFVNKDDAYQYIISHKPMFSISDIKNKFEDKHFIGTDYLLEILRKDAKENLDL